LAGRRADVTPPRLAQYQVGGLLTPPAEYRLLRHGTHRALSAVDLLICATALHHDLIVLHDGGDFVTAARHLPDFR
jgi:hypothetical protein